MEDGLERAKQIYFAYDGSFFYMTRDGGDPEYNLYQVPKDVERAWLDELTNAKVEALGDPSNYQSIAFFCHHKDWSHLDAILRVSPLGKLWQKCAFLEFLIEYVEGCRPRSIDVGQLEEAYRYVIDHAEKLRRRTRSESSRARVAAIVDKAEQLLEQVAEDIH